MTVQGRRARAYINVRVGHGFAANYLAVIKEIGPAGCLVSTNARFDVGQEVPLAVLLPGGGEAKLRGRVVRGHDAARGGTPSASVRCQGVSGASCPASSAAAPAGSPPRLHRVTRRECDRS